ncbi:MAG: hypothetical protein ACFE8C_10190 [Promethearchaeota archaeon]
MVIERKNIERISIDPHLSKSVLDLLYKIRKIEKNGNIKLLQVEFEGSYQSNGKIRKGYGKYKKLEVEYDDFGVKVPKKSIKLSDDYTIEDLIEAFEEFEKDLLDKNHNYKLDAYPNTLTILDKGSMTNRAYHLVEFKKVRKINKESPVAKILETIQMPLDLVAIYKAGISKKTGKYIRKGVIRNIDGTRKFVDADDVNRYTRNIYNSEFTKRTKCEVGIETKETKVIIPIEGGYCEIVPK